MIFHYIRIGISEIIHLPRVSKVATLVKMVLSIPKTRFKTKMSLSTFVKVVVLPLDYLYITDILVQERNRRFYLDLYKNTE